MGASYSSDIATKVKAASDEELKQALASISEADREKLSEALKKKVLIVCTSAAKMGDKDTGVWSEEVTGPYYYFKDHGCLVTVSSICGGDVPVDAGSLTGDFKTENDKRMEKDDAELFKNTAKLWDLDLTSFDIIFFSGGHGTCVDFPTKEVGSLVSKALNLGKVIGAVCHGPMALVNAVTETGESILQGKKIACFTDTEEDQVGLLDKVPFPLEKKLTELGAIIQKGAAWADQAVRDGNLVTGQNPQSSVSVAKLCLGL